MNKSILILNNEEDWNLEKPDFTPSQNLGYSTWGEVCKKLDIRLYRSNINWFKEGKFTKGWQFVNNSWQKVENEIKPNVIYDKCGNFNKITGDLLIEIHEKKLEIEKIIPLVNNTYFDNLIDNKLNQAVIFKDFLPYSRLALAGESITNEDGKTLVIKNIRGSGGKQVQITNDKEIYLQHNSIVQDFIDAKQDNEIKDFRVVFLGESPQYALSRIAAEGSLYTNFHRGASIEFIKLENIPDLLELCKKIIQRLEAFEKKIFSLDFMYDRHSQKYLLVEANTKPGLDVFSEESLDLLEAYLTNLSNYLIN